MIKYPAATTDVDAMISRSLMSPADGMTISEATTIGSRLNMAQRIVRGEMDIDTVTITMRAATFNVNDESK